MFHYINNLLLTHYTLLILLYPPSHCYHLLEFTSFILLPIVPTSSNSPPLSPSHCSHLLEFTFFILLPIVTTTSNSPPLSSFPLLQPPRIHFLYAPSHCYNHLEFTSFILLPIVPTSSNSPPLSSSPLFPPPRIHLLNPSSHCYHLLEFTSFIHLPIVTTSSTLPSPQLAVYLRQFCDRLSGSRDFSALRQDSCFCAPPDQSRLLPLYSRRHL